MVQEFKSHKNNTFTWYSKAARPLLSQGSVERMQRFVTLLGGREREREVQSGLSPRVPLGLLVLYIPSAHTWVCKTADGGRSHRNQSQQTTRCQLMNNVLGNWPASAVWSNPFWWMMTLKCRCAWLWFHSIQRYSFHSRHTSPSAFCFLFLSSDPLQPSFLSRPEHGADAQSVQTFVRENSHRGYMGKATLTACRGVLKQWLIEKCLQLLSLYRLLYKTLLAIKFI